MVSMLKMDLRTHIRIDPWALLFAILVSFLAFLGFLVFDRTIAGSDRIHSTNICVVMLAFCLIAAITYVAVSHLFKMADHVKEATPPLSRSFTPSDIHMRFFGSCLCVILLCWIPYLLIRFPGNFDPDTVFQIMQTYGLAAASDHHPWFDTLIFGAFWHMGTVLGSNGWSLLFYAILQCAITAASFSLTICYLRFLHVPKQIWIAGLCFYALYPIIPAFAQTMAKDMLFGWIWVLYLLSFIECMRTRGRALRAPWFLIFFSLASLLIALTKKTGIYIVIACAVALLIMCRKKQVLVVLFIPVALFCGLWQSILLPAWNIAPGGEQETMSVPSQQTAYYLSKYSDEITEDEWAILSGVFTDPYILPHIYDPVRADATKALWVNDAPTEAKISYFKWYISALFKHPDAFATALIANAYPLFAVDSTSERDESLLFFRDNVPSDSDAQSQYTLTSTVASWSNGLATTEEVSSLISSAYRGPFSTSLSEAADEVYLQIAQSLAILFSKVLFATWLPLFVLIYSIRTRNIAGAICLLPVFLASLFLLIGPIVLPRYLVCAVYSAPLAVSLLFLKRGTELDTAN